MNGMTWKDLYDLSKNLNDLALSVVLPKIGAHVFIVFIFLAFSRFIFSKFDYFNKYFDDKTNSLNIILNYITTYKNLTIIVSCIILTVLTFLVYKAKFNFTNLIVIFIYLFGLLSLFTQLFFNI
jgi:hypothetical protein